MLIAAVFLTLAWTAAASLDDDVIEVAPAAATASKKSAMEWVDRHQGELTAISDRIWEVAEIALQEFESSALLADHLEKAGFEVTRGVSDMSTAFVAEYGEGKPVIGILAEYDALPGLSQKAASRQEALTPGAPGHGCGHNVFGAGSAGAALALQHVMKSMKLPGTIRLYGSPAEENYSGKTYMARDGWFDELDAALHWHPSDENDVSLLTSSAMNGVKITFSGQAAHAAESPWSGRSALDAVELLNISMNYLREHMKLSSRVHYVVTEGGAAANIVPDRASVWYMIRDQDRAGVDYLHDRLLDSAKGASLMTRTTYTVEILEGTWNLLVLEEGAKLVYSNLLLVGAPPFTEEEQAFARAIQEQLGIETKGLATDIEPLERPDAFTGSGSTDVADVSWVTPTLGFGLALAPEGSPGHDWSIVACGGSTIAHKTLTAAAKVLAATALDLYQDPKLLEAIRAEWSEKTKGIEYKSAIPDGQKPPPFEKPSSFK